VREAPVVAPRLLNPSVPRDLETICLKCLNKEPSKRYGTARELADDLRRFLNGEPIRARPSTTVLRVLKWIKRRPTAAALVGISVLAVAGLLVMGGQVYDTRLEAALAEAKRERTAKEQESVARAAVEAERDATGRALTHATGLRLIAQSEILRAANPGLALVLAVEGAQRHPGTLANNTLLAALAACDERRTLLGHQDDVYGVCFSPDGRRILSASADHTARLWDADTGRLLQIFAGHTKRVAAARFSQDGRPASISPA
jgi:hypothetical protein